MTQSGNEQFCDGKLSEQIKSATFRKFASVDLAASDLKMVSNYSIFYHKVSTWSSFVKPVAFLIMFLLSATEVLAQELVPPEVVKLENVLVEGDMKSVYVGNANNHYMLYCDLKASGGCITPEENQNYLLFDAKTRWKLSGAVDFMTLGFIQDWTVKYNQGENVGLVAEQSDHRGQLGLFIRNPDGGGYEQNVIFSDGPIIYATGMSATDRQLAWKTFFTHMVQAAALQHGKDAIGPMLARRCPTGENICSIMLDAELIGIGGINEPRKVLVIVSTDFKDQNIQLSRSVCTYPADGTSICRDFDTGKLVGVKHSNQ